VQFKRVKSSQMERGPLKSPGSQSHARTGNVRIDRRKRIVDQRDIGVVVHSPRERNPRLLSYCERAQQ
jgi:hypothetical protein